MRLFDGEGDWGLERLAAWDAVAPDCGEPWLIFAILLISEGSAFPIATERLAPLAMAK